MHRIAILVLAFTLLSCRGDAQMTQALPSSNQDFARTHTSLSPQQKHRLLDGRCDLITSASAMPNALKGAFMTTTGEQGFELAEPGSKYQTTDVVERGSPTLPYRRLVFAGHCDDRWFIYYEHGGIAHGYSLLVYQADANQVLQFIWGGAGFVLAKNLDDLRSAIQTGKFADNLPFHW